MITKVLLCFLEEADVCVRIISGPSEDSVVSSSCVNFVFEVRPRRAGGLAVCTRLESPRVCRYCGTEE